MPKRHDETYQQYMDRVINPISPSFCLAKWYNATIWLGSGTTTSCHHPPAHKINPHEIESNPSALHNTQHKKNMRKLMLEGNRPSECEYCWKIEDINRGNVSDRAFKSVIYTDTDATHAANLPWESDVDLKTLEIAFDRTCQFACSYCNASFSSTWAKDIKQNGPYENLISDGGAAYTHDGSWAQPFGKNEDNPYVKAFWAWWPKLSKTLTELRVTGGEPLMSPDVWRLFDEFSKPDMKCRLAVNSNLGAKDDLIDRLIAASHGIENFDLYTSNESVGVQAEYIRDGLNYQQWIQNSRRLMTEAKMRGFHVMMTINGLCLFSITELMDQMLEWKAEFGKHMPTWSVNILRFPSFMNPLSLPNDIKDERREHLRSWFNANSNNPLMHDMEKEGIARLIDYLEVVNDPHRNTSSIASREQDMLVFHKQYDKRRGKNIRLAFPQLSAWLDDIEKRQNG